MNTRIFSQDCPSTKPLKITEGAPIAKPAGYIHADENREAVLKGDAFAQEITDRWVADFEKPGDKMAHVSTFIVVDDTVYMTYYANTKEPSEDPRNQTARLAYAPLNNPADMTFIDLQTTGHTVGGKIIDEQGQAQQR